MSFKMIAISIIIMSDSSTCIRWIVIVVGSKQPFFVTYDAFVEPRHIRISHLLLQIRVDLAQYHHEYYILIIIVIIISIINNFTYPDDRV